MLVGVVVAAVACSGSGSNPKSAVDAAVNATRAGHTLRETVSSGTPTASGTQTSTAAGTYSFTRQIGELTVDTGALLGKVEVVLSGSTLYIRVPAAFASAVPKGKTWVSGSLDHPPTIPGAGNLLSLAGGADPTRVLESLQHASTKVTKVGSATVNAIPATQYRVDVDLTKDSSPLAASEIKLLGGSKLTDDVFVGQGGQVARVVAHVSLSGGAVGTVTTDYDTFGIPVTAAVPPADQVVDAGTLGFGS
jgi:hypothetical protein